MPTEDNLNSLIADMDKLIKQIESDINRNNITIDTITLLNELNKKRKETFNLKLDSKEFKKIKKEYGLRILALKKNLVFYYNSSVVSMIYMLKDMLSNIGIIADVSERNKLLNEFNNLEIPKLYEKNISNFQDNISIDFDKFININNKFKEYSEKIPVDKNNLGEIEIGYVTRYAIPKIDNLIERYNNGIHSVTKQSINLDILLCRVKIRDIERKYKDNDDISRKCLEARNSLDSLSLIVDNSKARQNNGEYYSFKNEIMNFSYELNDYYNNKEYTKKDLEEFKRRYNDYILKVENKYKHVNIQLYNNLIRYLDSANTLIKKIEFENNKDVSHNDEKNDDDKYYRVETVEDAKDFYKQYSKPVMLASAVASMAIVNTVVGPVLIPTIIFANVVAANKYPIIDKINLLLEKAIGAKRDSKKNVIKQNNLKLNVDDAINGLLKGIALLDKKSKSIINDLTTRVRNSMVVVKIVEHSNNLKKSYNIRKQELFDLKVIKLYYEFVMSGLSLNEFCEDREISDELFDNLVDYMQYKDNNDRGLKR